MSLVYRNSFIVNQRGGALSIDNSTEQEKVKLSQRSGSNITLTNVVNSELATNNKQINVIHDSFETVGNDKTIFAGKNLSVRTGEDTIALKGFINQSQLDAASMWKTTFDPVAKINAQFKISRGGIGYPNGDNTMPSGTRADNPVIGSKVYTVENIFHGYSGVPVRNKATDEVSAYAKVPDVGNTAPAKERKITISDISNSAGITGSNAPGVVEFGAEVSASTENGLWDVNEPAQNLDALLLDAQELLNPIEQQMGHGGEETLLTKKNKFEQVGAVFNDYPSIRVDEYGRSQPLEMLVSDTGAYKNHDYVPHIEEVDNSSNFPGGNDDKIICNRYSRTVGSGGIQLKTTGATELGGTTLKAGYKRIHLNASHGIQIASESFVELQSLKSITLRTNRQVYVESALGVKGNLVVGGGAYVEGELYVQHITAPLEVQQTEDTILLGKFATDANRKLVIGEAQIGSSFYPVFALANDNLVLNYPHSHHYNGVPMRLTKSNSDVRVLAQNENINAHDNISLALAQNHSKKESLSALHKI